MSKKRSAEAEEEVKETAEEVEETPEAEQEELDPKDKEIASLKDQLMRNMAEYDNYRKRTARERIELQPEITAKVTGEFLTVLDGLERALQSE